MTSEIPRLDHHGGLSKPPMVALGHMNVLVVEDDNDDYYVVNHQINHSKWPNITVHRADCLAEAIAKVKAMPIDMVLLDLGLPESSGYDTLTAFFSGSPGIPVVVLTGYNDSQAGLRSLKMGAIDFIEKSKLTSVDLGTTLVFAQERASKLYNLQQEATTDYLTGLPNRSDLSRYLSRLLAIGERYGDGLDLTPYVALIDLDGFKDVNDNHGHLEGDKLLCAVANQIQSCIRTSDYAARLGGDEFVVILYANTDTALDKSLTRILEGIKELSRLNAKWAVSASIGVTKLEMACSIDALLDRADIALYDAKGQGKGRYIMYQ